MLKAILHLDRAQTDRFPGGIDLALQSIDQLRSADPEAAIVLVATGTAVRDLQADGARPGFAKDVTNAVARGVWFYVCEASLKEHGAHTYSGGPSPVFDGVRHVAIGLGYILELQSQGYGYIKISSQTSHD